MGCIWRYNIYLYRPRQLRKCLALYFSPHKNRHQKSLWHISKRYIRYYRRVTLAHRKTLPIMNPWLELAGPVLRGKADLLFYYRRNELYCLLQIHVLTGLSKVADLCIESGEQHSTTPIKDKAKAICTLICFLTLLSPKTDILNIIKFINVSEQT